MSHSIVQVLQPLAPHNALGPAPTSSQRPPVAQDAARVLSTGECHVEPALVLQEAQVALAVGSHSAEHHHLLLTALQRRYEPTAEQATKPVH